MTKKRFYKLRNALITKMMLKEKKYGRPYNFKNINNIQPLDFKAGYFSSYQEAWETLKPLRDALQFYNEK